MDFRRSTGLGVLADAAMNFGLAFAQALGQRLCIMSCHRWRFLNRAIGGRQATALQRYRGRSPLEPVSPRKAVSQRATLLWSEGEELGCPP